MTQVYVTKRILKESYINKRANYKFFHVSKNTIFVSKPHLLILVVLTFEFSVSNKDVDAL